MIQRVDAIVIGASIRGLVAAHVLDALGYTAVVVERGGRLGGTDGSFYTPGGSQFDFGLHVLDYMRSELVTRLFSSVVGERVHRQTLQRGIVLRNHLMPYNPRPAEMPAEVRSMLSGETIVDDLGRELPTRQRLGKIYGEGFADLIFDEVLPSYPTENRHRALGVDESRLVTNIYPWFFPRAERRGEGARSFHDEVRGGQQQEILYPEEGGFAGFAEGFVRQLDPERVEVITGARDLSFDVGAGTHRIDTVTAGGRTFAAPHVFWAAPWPVLCELLELPCQRVVTDRVFLGSFRLSAPASTDYHEVLVGDPQLRINRLSFPARFRRSDEPLMQIEFSVPEAEDWPTEAEQWREIWVDDLRKLGLLGADHRVEEFDFRQFPLHFNGFGAEGEPFRDADPELVDPAGNVRPVVPSMANLNLNNYVPRAVEYVASVLARS